MIAALAGTVGAVWWVVAAWNGELYDFSLWAMLGIIGAGSVIAALVSNLAPRMVAMIAAPLAIGSLVAAAVALFRGNPAWAVALAACTAILAGPQITAREVMNRSYGIVDPSEPFGRGF